MGEGVEWALHCCLTLAWSDPEEPVPAARLAAYYDLPPAYFNKQLQALSRAEIVTSVPGPRGGFRLNRAPEQISLMDVVAAIEGPDPAFRCTDLRRHATGGVTPPPPPAPRRRGAPLWPRRPSPTSRHRWRRRRRACLSACAAGCRPREPDSAPTSGGPRTEGILGGKHPGDSTMQ